MRVSATPDNRGLLGLLPALAMALIGLPPALLPANALAQDFPARLVRILATEAGGGGDTVVRILSPELASAWGRPVVIENKPAQLGYMDVLKAAPDGHTLVITSSSLWLLPILRANISWDALRDFTPVIQTIHQPAVLAVNASLPARNLKELITLAKARPGELNYAAGVIGGAQHLATELFLSMADIKVTAVYYKGTAPAITAVLGDQAQMVVSNAPSILPHIKSGRMRALGITLAQPSALVPDVPTIATAGVPGYEADVLLAIFGPGNMPASLVSRINQDFARSLNKPEVKERLFASGVEVAGGPPQQLQVAVKAEITKWTDLIRKRGIKLD